MTDFLKRIEGAAGCYKPFALLFYLRHARVWVCGACLELKKKFVGYAIWQHTQHRARAVSSRSPRYVCQLCLLCVLCRAQGQQTKRKEKSL